MSFTTAHDNLRQTITLAGAHRLQDHRSVRRQLEGVAVAARYDRGAATPFFLHDRGSEEVVGLVSGRLCGGEPAGGDELRHDIELIEQLGVEDAPALIAFEGAVPVSWRVERIPADEHGAGLILRV